MLRYRTEPVRDSMLSKVATVVLCALLALNLSVTGIASPSLAAMAGLSAHQLEKDSDFVRAIVQKCRAPCQPNHNHGEDRDAERTVENKHPSLLRPRLLGVAQP